MLRKHDTNSKKIHLILPIFIAKSAKNKLKLTVDRDRLPNYLFISIKKCYELMEGFYLPEPKRNVLPRVKIDYKKLAEEYRSFIEAGIAKNQSELAKKLKVSRAWVTKVFKLGVK